ncbi:hypothetical protein LB506_001329 [Fusarium annulatum]|nr:hypothetical protein LB506_001329 [Fusarium annulatum]
MITLPYPTSLPTERLLAPAPHFAILAAVATLQVLTHLHYLLPTYLTHLPNCIHTDIIESIIRASHQRATVYLDPPPQRT